MDRTVIVKAIVAALVAGLSPTSPAWDVWRDDDQERSLSLDATLKIGAVSAYSPNDPMLYPRRWSATGLTRLRLTLDGQLNERARAELAYEQRARIITKNAGAGGASGLLPDLAQAPYRLTQLDWQIARDGDTFSYRHEIDRAFVSYQPAWGEVVVGRQAIGLGRGVMFGAVDVFAPFSPAEIDRDWRRGVDAVRLQYRTSATSSVELIGAFGRSWDDSALLLRARGYVGRVDGELVVGKRARDLMVGAVLSAAVGDAEAHLEFALFDTPEAQANGGLFGIDHLVAKIVAGTSYTFDVGNGLTVYGEYHYSGFGVPDLDNAQRQFTSPDFLERLARGDLQILGRHAFGCQASYPFNDTVAGSLLVLVSPTDGSGVVSPSVRWDLTQSASLTLAAYVPWGSAPRRGRITSEYGSAAASVYLQLGVYF